MFADCTSLTEVTIPGSVTEIGDYAFADCTSLTEVTIPGSVTEIDDYAFRDCTSLTEVTISAGVTTIGEDVFDGCTSLREVSVDESNPNYKSVDGVLFSRDMKTLVLYPAGKTDAAYTIPDGVTEIGWRAFYDCTSLTEVTIPDSVVMGIDGFMFGFDGCTSLREISVDENNPDYKSVDGVLFSKDMKTLLWYPAEKTDAAYTIPDGVINIFYWAFSDCAYLTSLTFSSGVRYWDAELLLRNCTSLREINVDENNPYYKSVDGVLFSKDMKTLEVYPAGKTDATYTIPDGVTAIDIGAFNDCTNLTSVTIPDCVKHLEYSNGIAVFDGCENLTIYCYAGSAAHTYAIDHRIPFVLLAETGFDPDLDIDEEAGVIRPEAGSTAEALLAALGGSSFTITDAKGAALAGGALVGTGAVVTGKVAGETVRYTVIVRGDVTGDGKQTAADYLRTKRAVLKISTLEGAYYEAAACYDGRDGLTAADYLRMKRTILGLS